MKYGKTVLLAVLLAVLTGCGAQEQTAAEEPAAVQPEAPAAAEIDRESAVEITLTGGGAQIDGSGAAESDGVVTITSGGTYVLRGTLTDGRVIVNAPGKDVTLVFDGVSIACSYGSPVYVYQSAATTIHLDDGSENTLTDGAAYTFADSFSSAAEEEPNACLYSKSDLVIQGTGTLIVEANYNNGVTSKDTLAILDAALTVTAVNHGVNGKDSNTIAGAQLTVTCGGDAIRATNDTDSTLGYVSISDSVLALTSGEDGIQAETWAALSGGSFAITSGGGSGASLSADVSAKGVKAGTALTVSGGDYVLDCCDDAFHANGDLTVTDGTFTVSTGDDAFHADAALTVSGGTIDILTAYEGLEGSDVTVSGGEISLVSSDDGVNAAGGADGSGFGGFGAFQPTGGDHTITLSGGTLRVRAGGDGIDSNGTITMTGGTVLVVSTGRADGALDYESSCSLSGGTLLAVCSGSMAQAPTDPEQNTVSVQLGQTLPAGTYLQLTDGEHEFVFCLPEAAGHLVFSAPELEDGDYTLSYGGAYTGGQSDLLCSGGTYEGGTQLAELTVSGGLATYGQVGVGGSRGGGMAGMPMEPGGFGGGGRGERPADDGGERPGGTRPDDGSAVFPDDGSAVPPDGGKMPADRDGAKMP